MSKSTLEDLALSQDEVDRLKKCMQDKEFRRLFEEYAKEISDPENKKKYEEEIRQAESIKGVDVKFLFPYAGHVIKTTFLTGNKEKCFINICTNENLDRPKSTPSHQGNKKGIQWSIPHSSSEGRKDVDAAGNPCVVYDVLFHPATYQMTTNEQFKLMIHNTAVEAVEQRHRVQLDKKNIKTPKMKFKGVPKACVLRTPKDPNGTLPPQDNMKSNFMKEVIKRKPITKAENKQEIVNSQEAEKKMKEIGLKYVTPQYKIVHRGYFDMLDLSYIPGVVSKEASKNRPKELVIDIDLPKLKSATNLKLDIFERKVFLESTEDHCNYKLNIKLDYEVDRTKGNARFDKSKKKLIVTLEVNCPPEYAQKEIIKELNDERLKKYCSRHKDKENDMQSRFTMSKDTQFHYQHGPNYVDDDDDFLDYNSEKKTSKENKKQNKSCVEKYTGEPLVYTNDSIIQILQSVQEEKVLHKCPQFTFFQDEEYVNIVVETPNLFPKAFWYVVYDDKVQLLCVCDFVREEKNQNSLMSLWIYPDDGSYFDPSRSRVNVTVQNIVMNLCKLKTSVSWDHIKAGIDPKNLHKRRFTTSKNVVELFSMTYNQAKECKPQVINKLSIVKKNDHLCVVDIESNNNDENSFGNKNSSNQVVNGNKNKNNSQTLPNSQHGNSKNKKSNKKGKKNANNNCTEKTKNQQNDNGDHKNKMVKNIKDARMDDSDDELDEEQPAIVVKNGDSKKVITCHKNKSKIKLTSADIALQLDN